jgi:phosphate transport system permease protein
VADGTKVLTPGEPFPSARPVGVFGKGLTQRLLVDRLARRLVSLGGIAIIGSILAILFVIAAEVYPLFKAPTAFDLGEISLGASTAPLAIAVDEYREIAYHVTPSGVQFVNLKGNPPAAAAPFPIPSLGKATVVATSPLGRGAFALGLSDGRVIPAEVKFKVLYTEKGRKIDPEVVTADPLTLDPEGRAIRMLAYTAAKGGVTVGLVAPRTVVMLSVKETKALIGPSTRQEARQAVSLPIEGEVAALSVDGRGEDLFVGTSSGHILRVDLRDPSEPKMGRQVPVTNRPGVSVTALAFLLGDRTLVVGDGEGGVSSWQLLRSDGGEARLVRTNQFAGHAAPVVAIEPSRRDKGFITADRSGAVRLHYATSGKTLLSFKADLTDLRSVSFAPKADALLIAGGNGHLSHWGLHNPHPEITLRSLFGRIWYEGYTEPDFVWQSTGGTDDFESKLSLTPLIYGTLKGTFYALLVAVPIALLGALYASQFMHPALKGIVKPTVEIMAALPSVVLGFLAGLWLAPQVEKVVPGLFLTHLVIPILIFLSAFAWQFVPAAFRSRLRPGTEVALLIPIAVLGAWLSFSLGGAVERLLLSGDHRHWLLSVLGLTYDQRNSLVVGIAMGFAVIPIIFTIAEDSLSNVPQHLVAGSLALGATRWQTALRVVLPTASPGIFSAIMIGFGRAVGETMIVLMATGNTPILSWSIFNGFRALSANIAVELPEAPEGGTLFRVLFLAALLLFIMTFIVNTAAELVRLRLRKKYRYL